MVSPLDENKLNQFKKSQLIELVIELQREKEVLKTQQDSQSILVERITEKPFFCMNNRDVASVTKLLVSPPILHRKTSRNKL